MRMKKIAVEKNVFIPMPVCLVGALVEGKPNFLAVGWVSRVNGTPPMVAVGLNKGHYTAGGIMQTETFSVCFPGPDLVEKTDYCGMVSGRKADKSALFQLFYGETKTAPMIAECPLCLECRLDQAVQLPTNTVFIGKIAGAYSEERFMSGGMLDFEKIDPMLLTMPDNTYWSLGKTVGKAWSAGKGMMGGKGNP
jgi:flavin reductase (DIM6/NTAB) family NADH-FMN oxidoreductase RutF